MTEIIEVQYFYHENATLPLLVHFFGRRSCLEMNLSIVVVIHQYLLTVIRGIT
jgi:hypothetical protein